MVYRLSRALIRLVLRVACGFRVEGGEHEPPTGPLLIVSNHVSDLDPLVVGVTLRRPTHFMAKEELFRPPLLRWWITACGGFPVRRGEPDRGAFRTARAILERGGALGMFPEGTRGSSLRDLRPPEPGAALLALRTGATILPVAVIGTDVVLPRGASRPRRGTIRVRVGAPIRVDGAGNPPVRTRADRERIDALGQMYMGVIARLLGGSGGP
ncbi:MAG TPA: lysophospholipid acyltransferase family protein [bacterium]|nr:lysophospholipid acyltransferase family protein [bacterium]